MTNNITLNQSDTTLIWDGCGLDGKYSYRLKMDGKTCTRKHTLRSVLETEMGCLISKLGRKPMYLACTTHHLPQGNDFTLGIVSQN